MKKLLRRLSDLDPFPFGEWKGTLMKDVPARYLNELQHQEGLLSEWPDVAEYIQRASKALVWELKHMREAGV
ncbi:MAG: hypothetical protein M1608_16355 [Candidatus Omnitrophica bacterium]|nr:hypothetical protein [Candidatus Omnitrophota bacterium]